MSIKYIVIQQHAWCTDGAVGIEYLSDLIRHDTRDEAISHGFNLADSDDFNIGEVEDGRLVSLDWMQKPVGESPETLAQIAELIGLEALACVNDKGLSNPVAWKDRAELAALRNKKLADMWKEPHELGCDVALYSPEYVQLLLGRIESMAQAHIALQQLCEVYRSAYEEASRALKHAEEEVMRLEKWREEYQGKLNAEHVRVGRQYMERLGEQEKRIAELEAIVNTPVKLPIQAVRFPTGGLTVQED